MLEKARRIEADEIVIDLEDAVAATMKDEARGIVAAELGKPGWRARGVAVRVNQLDSPWFERDLAALAARDSPPASIVLPKVEGAADLSFADRLGPIRLQALIETARGLARVEEIAAASERLDSLILGYADLAASLGRSRTAAADPGMWLPAQDAVLLAARANGLQAIDGPFLGVEPGEPFQASARHARDLGFDGKWAIHPSQVDPLNEIFTPDAEEVERARAIVAALAAARRDGGRGAVALDGEMIDEALRVGAERVLARAAQTGEAGGPR